VLRVGNPEQIVRVLPSTAGQKPLVIIPQGCIIDVAGTIADSNCTAARGGLFNPSQSESWDNLGDYALGLDTNLGYNDTGTYGLDSISLGFTDVAGGLKLKSQVIVSTGSGDFYLGLFGLGVQGTTLVKDKATESTYLRTLKDNGLIPSLSWGYTAGAGYRKCISIIGTLVERIRCYVLEYL
jgi:hypothetical protein